MGAYKLSLPTGWVLIQGWVFNQINMVIGNCRDMKEMEDKGE